ncbi:molybdopterin cofactor-binding domain-containing protein [Bradyrhizobium sp. AUGA SZCCT0283]|uniref:molybdopterin cofactor-binding domain-containing protein n=1 Tax=Bradyrhizobium sp. AUGA SZCCT0283 TaxID=2807671 RepID=UPI0028A0C04B|nr:molybdopterin cofactor-binding domain-containing protein [Bradyrhizobium sp. AUGA SZCCT0283]
MRWTARPSRLTRLTTFRSTMSARSRRGFRLRSGAASAHTQHLRGREFHRRARRGREARPVRIPPGSARQVAARQRGPQTCRGWGRPLLSPDSGRGISLLHAFGETYIAEVAEVSVSNDGEVRVQRVVCAVDCGMIVNPDTVKAQMESGIIFVSRPPCSARSRSRTARVEQGISMTIGCCALTRRL